MSPVLGFWFGSDPEATLRRADQWLTQHPQMRYELRGWARPLVRDALCGSLDSLGTRPRGRLAVILMLDAMPRILWRGTERAYAGDLAAQGHALRAIADGQLDRLAPIERLYALLPLVHSEDPEHQRMTLKRCGAAVDDADGLEAEVARRFLHQAREHHDIIHHFGRFPDRNGPLHRMPRPGETAFLRSQDHLWFAPRMAQAA